MSRDATGTSTAGTPAVLAMFMTLMLISGSCNTLLMKFMVMQQAPLGPAGRSSGFDHPYFQSLLMMIGEFLCLLVYLATREPKEASKAQFVPKHVFMIACLLDWTATTLVNMAYVVIPASVVQMTRGAIVIFTCLFSVLFLHRKQHGYHIVGVSMVFAGITLVSLSAFMNPAESSSATASKDFSIFSSRLVGIGLCVGAQVFQASMLVYEEKIMSHFSIPPLKVVGMEGTCGIFVGVLLLGVLNAINVESTPAALYQISHSTPLLVAVVGSIISIAVFNYSGVTVTQQASAVARSTIDVSRTILIWAVELLLRWNSFNLLQLAGFAVLAVGTLIYNRLVVIQALEPAQESQPVLAEKQNIA